ncbi:hypothetical protein [Algoriphagus sp. PAP.12]|uniref:hypothetical protein n=1 Tax=Algoriphagus sp. PAP.12 TaxID=2996678 RepID=UPI00227B078E|nr:hypothetical protein [Algoriphagus sp. PAP.12]
MNILEKKLPILFLLLVLVVGISTTKAQSPLFASDEILDLKLKFSVKDIRKDSNDSTYVDEVIWFKNESGEWEELEVEMRTRGNFRLNNCYFPPLRLKFKKKRREGTVFEQNKSLKLVMPCSRAKNADAFIAKEFMCYKMMEEVTPYTFSTRMVRLYFENEDDKKGEEEILFGFLIEDDDDVADRFNGEILDDKKILGTLLEDSAAVRHDIFQYMIGNTDFSGLFKHNQKVMQLDERTVVPLAYDFDMTGFVNPPYAQVSNLVEIESVTQRLYRGFCREEALLQAIRAEFLEKEEIMFAIIEEHQEWMSSGEKKEAERFLGEFYSIIKNDKAFEKSIISSCRSY